VGEKLSKGLLQTLFPDGKHSDFRNADTTKLALICVFELRQEKLIEIEPVVLPYGFNSRLHQSKAGFLT
jgi:hypothetical protein